MTEPDKPCSVCRRVELWREGRGANFIHEFESSILLVGDHQFHRGYCLLVLKAHVRELHELGAEAQAALFRELMEAGRAVAEAFGPWKMNYSCYGNVDPHVHWHLFPRYDTEPDHLGHPWLHAAEFGEHATGAEEARAVAERVGAKLARR